MTSIRDRANVALKDAMRAKDREATSVYRTLLSAFSNAEAVPSTARAGAIETAGAVGGADVEVRRRQLSTADLEAVARAEIDELHTESTAARERDDDATADRLLRQARLLEALVDR